MKTWLTALERLPLMSKLVAGFAGALLITLILGAHGIYTERYLNREIQTIFDKELLGVASAKSAQFQYAIIGRSLRQALLATDTVGRDQALKQYESAEAQLRKDMSDLRKRLHLDDNQKNLAKFDASYAAYKQNVDRVVALTRQDRIPEARALVTSEEFQRSGQTANEALAVVARLKEEYARTRARAVEEESAAGERLTLLLLVLGLGGGILAGVLVGQSIRRPTERLRETVEQLAAGKLGLTVPDTGYPNEIGALARSIAVLQTEAQRMETERWVKTHQSEISSVLQSATSFTELARKFL
ncbi:MAG: MCP four helix bundle domain-containing protein, partial [Proteobacteria bacterium]|nr:MCP four helix bundle domain-containing protein [Pseudomonadota bacterium]